MPVVVGLGAPALRGLVDAQVVATLAGAAHEEAGVVSREAGRAVPQK